jgi:hypothetical protein
MWQTFTKNMRGFILKMEAKRSFEAAVNMPDYKVTT